MINRIPLERVHRAAEIVLGEARKDGKSMAFAVVDEAGGLVYAIRDERTATRVLTHAIRKAYTSAIMQRDTITFRDQDKEKEKTLADWGDVNLTHLVGGVVITEGDEVLGGLGVGGNSTERDDEISHLALRAVIEGEAVLAQRPKP